VSGSDRHPTSMLDVIEMALLVLVVGLIVVVLWRVMVA
jgi:hypothetical protein